MLYLNDEAINGNGKLSEDQKKSVHKELGVTEKDIKSGRWSMTIKMPEYFYSKSDGNDKMDRPATAVIPLNCQKDDDGSQTWNYCSGRSKSNDKWLYFWNHQGSKSSILSFSDKYTIPASMIDLIYFLLFLSPMREILGESEENMAKRGVKASQRFQFVVENKEKEAALRINKNKLRVQVQNAIIGDDGLSVEKIRTIASAFHISNAETKSELELRDELLATVDKLEATGKKGFEQFVIISKLDAATEIKASIQKGLDAEIITEDTKGKQYCYLTKEGKKGKAITQSIGARTLRESLEFHLENNPNALDELKNAIEEKQLMEV